jgi:predicted Zn-dependent protease
LPEWLGPLAIFSIVLTLIPVVLISREDVAYRNIAQFTVTNDDSKLWVKMNFEKLTDFSLLEPAKVNAILPNLYASGLSSEAERVILNLYKNEPSDVYVNDVLATFYQNSNQWDKEIEIRERMRKLSPLDYRLEAILARAYFDNKEVFKLMSSVERLKTLAPGSEEYSNANILLEELRSKS